MQNHLQDHIDVLRRWLCLFNGPYEFCGKGARALTASAEPVTEATVRQVAVHQGLLVRFQAVSDQLHQVLHGRFFVASYSFLNEFQARKIKCAIHVAEGGWLQPGRRKSFRTCPLFCTRSFSRVSLMHMIEET
jgi:hypothetical protein